MYGDIVREQLGDFLADSFGQLEVIRRGWEYASAEDPGEQVTSARQTSHQLKGNSSLVGFTLLSHVSYWYEATLDWILESPERRHEGYATLATIYPAIESLLQDAAAWQLGQPTDPSRVQHLVQTAWSAYLEFTGDISSGDHPVIRRCLAGESTGSLASDSLGATTAEGSAASPAAPRSSEPHETPSLAEFRDTAREQLEIMTDALSRQLADAADVEAVFDLCRRLHDFKGNAGLIGQQSIATMLHALEDTLEHTAAKEKGLTSDVALLVSEALDRIGEVIEGNARCEDYFPQLIEQCRRYAPGIAGTGSDSATVARPIVDPSQLPTCEELISQLNQESAIPTELADVFAEEAQDHLARMYAGLEQLRSGNAPKEVVQQVRRATHTLKGAAGAVGLRVVSKLAHRMEDLLDHLYEHHTHIDEPTVTLLFATTDLLEDLAQANFDRDRASVALAELFATYAQLLPQAVTTQVSSEITITPPPTTASPSAVPASTGAATRDTATEKAEAADGRKERREGQVLRVPLDRLDELVRVVGEVIINRTSFEQRMLDLASSIDELRPVLERLRHVSREMETRYSVDALRQRRATPHDGASLTGRRQGMEPVSMPEPARFQEFDALEFDRYTEFHLLARSLSESTNDVGTVANQLRTLLGDFDSLLARQGRLARDAQDRLMKIRMVPLNAIVTRLNRAVRVVASNQRKQVELLIDGGDTELDKVILEEIADPLLHLVRNAVDHGIEPPELRVARGKPATAHVRISACHQGTQAIVRVSDDGNGLDVERIRAALVRQGYVSATEAESLSSQELHRYIFLPGFSTASKVSEVSGRGVGMDIVRDTVQRLKGTVHVESTPGQGTTFTIALPLTLAVTRALLIQVNTETYALPLQSIMQILRVKKKEIGLVGKRPMVNVAGKARPIVHLASRIGHQVEDDGDTSLLLVVRAADQEAAFVVDRILAGRDIVVKGLGDHLKHVTGLLGSTFLGDGRVVPILDPSYLVGLSDNRQSPQVRPNHASHLAIRDESLKVMIVDDSVSVRKVMVNLVRNAGWTPIQAKDGVDALEVLQTLDRNPDIFLLDIEMPRMDGYELLGTLRSREAFAKTPVIMVTSRAGDKHRVKAMDLGASGYVVKPYQDESVIQLIKRLATAAREVATV